VRDSYDWRAQERALNSFPQYRAAVDGVGIHFIHIPGSGPAPLPLLLSNGWPSSSSIRLYAPDAGPPPGPGDLITVPTSVLATREPNLAIPPESWLRRAYPNLTRLVALDQGGHFLALEAPDRFVAEIRAAFRPYRDQATSG
jgi:hypothetical protein